MIELIILDVDGTLTDGKIIYTNSGDEIKNFDVKDGLAIASWNKILSKKSAIITGRRSKLVEKRANELSITHLYQGVHDKDKVIDDILKKEGLTWENVAAIGDDLNDLKMLKKAALSFCPNDANEYIKKYVNIVTTKNGGNGAVRQMIEYICKDDGLLEEFYTVWG